MTTTEHSEGRHGPGLDETLQEPVLNKLSEFHDRLNYVLDEDERETGIGETVTGSSMPKIRGLDLLKEGIYEVDLEKTVHDMFAVIKSMESQMERVMRINVLFEKDLNDSKKMMAELKDAKRKLEEKVSRMEDEIPSKRELQIEIDHLMEERNLAQVNIHELKSKIEKTQTRLIECQKQMGKLGEERKDALSEVNFLESRLNKSTQKIGNCEAQINVLRGENLAMTEKLKGLEKDLTETLDEKYKLIRELKETKEAMNEIRSALADKKLQAKKSFYKGQEEKE
jgi:chromosome segregation ATPase